MARLSTNREFPTCVRPAELWDGVTYFGSEPSNSSTAATRVVGSLTKRPVGFTKQEMFQIYYRIKYLSISVSVGGVEYDFVDVGSPPYSFQDFPGNDWSITFDTKDIDDADDYVPSYIADSRYDTWAIDGNSSIDFKALSGLTENESKLPCSSYLLDLFWSHEGAEGTFLLRAFDTSFIYFYDDLYWPVLWFQNERTKGVGTSIRASSFANTYRPPSVDVEFFPFTDTVSFDTFNATILGKSVPYFQVSNVVNNDPDFAAFDIYECGLINSLTISASEYWEYRDFDGTTPLWDSATGEWIGP